MSALLKGKDSGSYSRECFLSSGQNLIFREEEAEIAGVPEFDSIGVEDAQGVVRPVNATA